MKNLKNRREVLDEEIKTLRRDIKEMKRQLKIKIEELEEINEELNNESEDELENQTEESLEEMNSEEEIIETVQESGKNENMVIEKEEIRQPKKCLNKRKEREEDQIEKRENKRRTLETIIEKLDLEIEEERKIDNGQRITTENLIKLLKEMEKMYNLARRSDELEKLYLFNYAESFQLRLKSETEKNLAEQTARTKVYKEIFDIGGFKEKDYEKIKKRTQRAEKFYKLVKEAGGREKIKFLEEISIEKIIKLTKEEIEYAIKELNDKKNKSKINKIGKIPTIIVTLVE